MVDLEKLSPKLSPRQHAVLLEMYRHPEHPVHRSPTNLTLKALRRRGLVELSWKDSVAGYMFGRQPCWKITDAGIRRILGVLGNNMEKEQSEDRPSIPEFEKTDANKLYDALETISLLEKKLDESEKRGSELAASYCDGVVGDEYGHPYCRYKVERDAALAEVERLRESKGDPSGSFDRCMKMMYERDENAKRLDAALARVAELEGKLTDWVHEGFRLNEALAVAKAQPSVPEISGIGRDAEHPRAVVLYLRNEPSDEDMRAIQNFLRAMAAPAQHSVPKAWLDVQAERRRQVEAQALRQEVAALRARADVVPEVFGLERYRVEKTGKGFWPYCVRAGDGTRELFVGHLKQCQRVATELATAFEDGKFIAAPGSSAQHSVPEGWKLVPMDPTSQMTYVGQSLRYDAVNSIGEIYRQMLAVAPSPIDPAAHPQPCQQPQAHPARCGCER
ncbi:hypothetical protein Pa193_088 [Pseudomonas virus Pa193]|uniref:Uncharacterized protein n=2 Tax=Pbunavirus TaxID=1198980 RepID=A0A5P1KVC9_9CAUD|nr:hypothetical protein H6S64_gp88 [Pseudomonas virus Pa193]QDH45998.1 hypothetical protein Pa193_088 [Pseudomonas virus Pa193]UXD82300.1 hypothetical protein NP274_00065 [Pseudomonas phage Kara-mokiny kep-wari Wadjak 8]